MPKIKKNMALVFGVASAMLTQTAFADSFNIENPDKLKIEIKYGDGESCISQAERIHDERHPKNNKITVIADDGKVLTK